jgi:hypothetical protein
MKFIFAALLCSVSVAHASVDYVAIGEQSSRIKSNIKLVQETTACVLKDYNIQPSCKKIEDINAFGNDVLAGYMVTPTKCGSQYVGIIHSISEMSQTVASMKEKAKEATSNDPVLAVIAKDEQAVRSLAKDLKETLLKAKLQETYVSTCLIGNEPTETIQDLLCK